MWSHHHNQKAALDSRIDEIQSYRAKEEVGASHAFLESSYTYFVAGALGIVDKQDEVAVLCKNLRLNRGRGRHYSSGTESQQH